MSRHPQVPVTWHGGTVHHRHVAPFTVDVDKDMAPLIGELWKARIFTDESCQENPHGLATVCFVDKKAGRLFARALRVAGGDPDQLAEDEWVWMNVYGGASVQFPPDVLPEVERRMVAYNRAGGRA